MGRQDKKFLSIILHVIITAVSVLHLMLRIFIFMLMLDAQGVMRERCHYYAPLYLHEKDKISVNTYFIKARATLQRHFPSLCLDYYEISFLLIKTTRSDAAEEGSIDKTFLHAEAQFFMLRPPGGNTLLSACPRLGISQFLSLLLRHNSRFFCLTIMRKILLG